MDGLSHLRALHCKFQVYEDCRRHVLLKFRSCVRTYVDRGLVPKPFGFRQRTVLRASWLGQELTSKIILRNYWSGDCRTACYAYIYVMCRVDPLTAASSPPPPPPPPQAGPAQHTHKQHQPRDGECAPCEDEEQSLHGFLGTAVSASTPPPPPPPQFYFILMLITYL